MTLDIIGKLYDIDGDPETPMVTELDGWHVNSTKPVTEWEKWRIEPNNKKRVFMGVDTYCYRFDDESSFLNMLNVSEVGWVLDYVESDGS